MTQHPRAHAAYAIAALVFSLSASACNQTQELGNGTRGGSGFSDDANGFGTEDAASSDAAVTPADCASACENAALSGCALDQSAVTSECVSFCANAPDQGQIQCLASSPCSALAATLSSGAPLCGIAAYDAGGSPALCAETCENRATFDCNSGDYILNQQCEDLCSRSVTYDETACLQTVVCSALMSGIEMGASVCGIPGAPDGGN